MLPKMPPRTGQVGFVYVHPFRIQGVSVAGEQTMIQVPELDVAFDIGMCPRIALASPYVALSHAHMDHIGGLPYYFSQRMCQRRGAAERSTPTPETWNGQGLSPGRICGPLRLPESR